MWGLCRLWSLAADVWFFLSTGPGQHMHGRAQFRLNPKTRLAWALWIWRPIAHNALQTERPKSLLELFHVPKSLLDKIPWDWESRTCRTFMFDSKGIRRIKIPIQPQNIRNSYWDKYAVEGIQGTGWLFFWAGPSGFQPGVSIRDLKFWNPFFKGFQVPG